MKTRISAISPSRAGLRKSVGLAIAATGAGILLQGALVQVAGLPVVIAAAAALAMAMLLALVAAGMAALTRPALQPVPVRVAFPAPHPWR